MQCKLCERDYQPVDELVLVRGTRHSPFLFLAPAFLCRPCVEETIPYEPLCLKCHLAGLKDHPLGGSHTMSPQERYARNWKLRRKEDAE